MKRFNATLLLARLLFLLGVMILISHPALAGKISISAGIDRNDIHFEDSLSFSLEIRWEGKVGDYQFELLPLPVTQNFKILGSSSAVSSDVMNGTDITIRNFRYTLQPTKGGLGIIEPVVLKYISLPDSLPGELSSQQFQILIREPAPMEKPMGGGLKFLLWAVPALMAASSAVVIIVVRRRRRAQAVSAKSAEELLLESLSSAKKELHSDRKLFFTRLYALLSHYLDHKIGLKTAGRTASEIVGDLTSSPMPDTMKEKMAAWLLQAEREKYAPLPGEPGEVLRLVTEMENLFEQILNNDKAEAK